MHFLVRTVGRLPRVAQRARRAVAERGLLVWALLGAASFGALSACIPQIGDKCTLSTDCSSDGTRLCDNSQPDGYCTEFNCSKNSCPDNAVCVFFDSNLQGCTYNDRTGNYGSRTARAFCSAECTKDSDCRDGYICADPKSAPYDGIVVDDDQTRLTCLVIPATYPDASVSTQDAALIDSGVCSTVGPAVAPIEAGAAQIYDGSVTAEGGDASSDAGDAGDASDAADAADGGG